MTTLHKRSHQNMDMQQERSRLARDIHDGAAQYLIHALYIINHARQLLEALPEHPEYRPMLYEDMHHVAHSVEMSLSELRQQISSLMPSQLQGRDLSTALRDLLTDFMLNMPGLTINADLQNMQAVPRPLAGTVFRLLQEALHNVYKHAHASIVEVRGSIHAGILLLEVSDNGVGLDETALHLGLRSLRERVQEVGGELEVESRAGRGTTVRIRIPL